MKGVFCGILTVLFFVLSFVLVGSVELAIM